MEDTPVAPLAQPPLGPVEALDVEQVARDLDAVEVALARLDAGTYGVCEASGAELPDEVLAADPIARRLPAG